MHAEGSNGSVTFDHDLIKIRHKGWANVLTQGLHGEKVIPIANITAVQFKPAGSFLAGFIQFTLLGGIDRPGGVMEATKDENAVLFASNQQRAFEQLRAQVEHRIAARKASPLSPTAGAAGELERLASLLERGFLSREEFDTQKRSLLGLSP